MIIFSDVKKSFGEKHVLKGISFQIKKAEIVFILGTSGTGKSVLLKNIVGLLRPDSGEIWIDGQETSTFKEKDFMSLRKRCGMVFQHPALFDSLSVFDNIAFGIRKHYPKSTHEEISERVKSCLDLVNLNGIEFKFPPEISYGMQKRVSLARTLAIQPDILLFDEPTTGLDPISTNKVNHLIKELSSKLQTTSIVVSHDMHCALDIADRIIVLDKGMVIENSSVEEVKKSKHPLVVDFLKEALANE